jgi:signal transduction histidine kinase
MHDRVLTLKESVSVEIQRDGRWFDADYLPFGDDLLVVTREMTQVKEADLRIRQLNATLEDRVAERTAELETFNQTLSHDLRAPLRWINSFAGLLERREGDRLDPQSRHYLQEVRSASEDMARLLEELLDYSRLGRHPVRSGPVAWAPIVDSLRAGMAERVAVAGARLDVVDPLGAVSGDPILIERILAVLIDNGLTYVEPGAAAHVTLSAERAGTTVRISVTDTGIGIDPEHHERIFEPFARLHDADEYVGSGIGLAVARRSARMMGTDVHLESAPGRGSTFRFVLPSG